MRIRVMSEADIDAVAAIRVHGWQTAYRGIVPQSFLDALDVAGDAAQRREFFPRSVGRVHNLVAEDGTGNGSGPAGGEVVGWAALGPYRGEEDVPDGTGELYALYTRPDRIGTGVGRALMSAAITQATSLGLRRLLLWVLTDNTSARRFYARAGFAPDGAVAVDDCEGVPLQEMRYARDL